MNCAVICIRVCKWKLCAYRKHTTGYLLGLHCHSYLSLNDNDCPVTGHYHYREQCQRHYHHHHPFWPCGAASLADFMATFLSLLFVLLFLSFRLLLSPLLMCKIALTIWMPPHWEHPTTSTSVCPVAPCERLLQRNLACGVYVIFLLKLSLVALCCARRRNTASWRKSNHFLMSTLWTVGVAGLSPGCAVCAVFNENMKVFFSSLLLLLLLQHKKRANKQSSKEKVFPLRATFCSTKTATQTVATSVCVCVCACKCVCVFVFIMWPSFV